MPPLFVSFLPSFLFFLQRNLMSNGGQLPISLLCYQVPTAAPFPLRSIPLTFSVLLRTADGQRELTLGTCSLQKYWFPLDLTFSYIFFLPPFPFSPVLPFSLVTRFVSSQQVSSKSPVILRARGSPKILFIRSSQRHHFGGAEPRHF